MSARTCSRGRTVGRLVLQHPRHHDPRSARVSTASVLRLFLTASSREQRRRGASGCRAPAARPARVIQPEVSTLSLYRLGERLEAVGLLVGEVAERLGELRRTASRRGRASARLRSRAGRGEVLLRPRRRDEDVARRRSSVFAPSCPGLRIPVTRMMWKPNSVSTIGARLAVLQLEDGLLERASPSRRGRTKPRSPPCCGRAGVLRSSPWRARRTAPGPCAAPPRSPRSSLARSPARCLARGATFALVPTSGPRPASPTPAATSASGESTTYSARTCSGISNSFALAS